MGDSKMRLLFKVFVWKRTVGVLTTFGGRGIRDGGGDCGSLRMRDWKYSRRDGGGGLPVYVWCSTNAVDAVSRTYMDSIIKSPKRMKRSMS